MLNILISNIVKKKNWFSLKKIGSHSSKEFKILEKTSELQPCLVFKKPSKSQFFNLRIFHDNGIKRFLFIYCFWMKNW